MTNPDKVLITISQAFFDKADLQNNKVCCYYEKADNDVYFVVHNEETFPMDFFKGKNLIIRDDNGNPVLGSFGLPTYKANPGSLSLGANYFVTTSERQALPQSITTTKVNYSFPLLSTNENCCH